MAEQTKCSTVTDQQWETLISKCREAKRNAYCPYSNFKVGAALLTTEGKIYTGCNVENAVYPLGICAERTAVVKAVSEGHKKFKAIALTSDLSGSFTSPCGSCRQVLAEFNLDMEVCMVRSGDEERKIRTVEELLPMPFTSHTLHENASRSARVDP